MSFKPNAVEQYVRPSGQLTIDGLKLLQTMEDRIVTLEAQLAAIAAVTAPSGGATIDAEARTAISAIITGAGT